MAKINATLFTRTHQTEQQEHCPACGGGILIKQGKHGPFKACANYPSCDYVQFLTHNDGHIIKSLGVACPECANELVLRQGRFGMFIGCSAYPVCQHIEKRDQDSQTAQQLLACPECSAGHLHEKQSRFGKRFYACDGYPDCKFAVNLKPVAGRCERCGFALLLAKPSLDSVSLICANKKCAHKQS